VVTVVRVGQLVDAFHRNCDQAQIQYGWFAQKNIGDHQRTNNDERSRFVTLDLRPEEFSKLKHSRPFMNRSTIKAHHAILRFL